MSFGKSFMQMIGVDDSDPINDISEEEIEKEKQRIANQQRKAGNASGSKATLQAPPQPPVQEPKQVSASAATKPQNYGRQERRFTIGGTAAFKLVLIEPHSFEECPKLVDSLKGKRPVIINLERLEVETAKKIFDFLSGATYALDGRVQKVANNIFIFAPANVDIAGGIREDEPDDDYDRDRPTLTTGNPWGGK